MLGGKREDRDGADQRRRCDDVFATRDFAAFARFLTLFRRRLFRGGANGTVRTGNRADFGSDAGSDACADTDHRSGQYAAKRDASRDRRSR